MVSDNLTSIRLKAIVNDVEADPELMDLISTMRPKYINRQDETGHTLLHYAAANSPTHTNNELVKLLIKKGANIDIQSKLGTTPLIGAVVLNNIESVKILIDAGADINIAQNNSLTSLMCALVGSSIYNNLDIIKLLIDSKADINKKCCYGNTALHNALTYSNDTNCVSIIKLLVSNGANVLTRNITGCSPLHAALADFSIYVSQHTEIRANTTRANIYDIVKILIDAGCDVNATDSDNNTPLQDALDNTKLVQRDQIINALVRAGGKVASVQI